MIVIALWQMVLLGDRDESVGYMIDSKDALRVGVSWRRFT